MFRHLSVVSALQGLRFTPNSASNLSVRWRRKPRWLPVAPTKRFKVPVRPEVPEDETQEMLRLNNFYRTQMRGIRRMLLEEIQRAEATAQASQLGSDSELAEHARCMAINDQWNESIIPVREARLTQQAKERADKAIRGLSLNEEAMEIKTKQIANVILTEKDKAATYITEANLDAAIEHALANPVDYNFVIDLEGNITHGRETKPMVKEGPET